MKRQIFILTCYILCALIWGGNFVCDLAFELYLGRRGLALTALHGVCAVVWTLAAVAQWLRMRRARKEQAGKEDG